MLLKKKTHNSCIEATKEYEEKLTGKKDLISEVRIFRSKRSFLFKNRIWGCQMVLSFVSKTSFLVIRREKQFTIEVCLNHCE